MAKTNKLNLDRYVPAMLTFLANKLATGASLSYRKHFGIGVVEWRLIALLAVEDQITANRICQVIGLDKSAVSRSLQALEAAGRITGKVDSQDARRYTVSLTPEGKALHDRVLKVALERERRLLGGLSPAEVDTLVDLLGRLQTKVAYVNEYDPPAEA
ncbi:MarR family winged helix-turn-helix transcriptional regulator [Pseudomonas sp. CFBP 13719]|uniref:MarR family winged helix-turn-helix transcriptional regulator n=1 Tax=Pseudomonas sp. CFBP 13719 TaxID=2775303 RepID=UPI00177D54BA|nr:MarR family winged helix-turn-helix transcriptional regulator [Pseudomonas sp. CFBP 13719]MBD8682529.1 winged helix-turn-helix transcriptional regulator [Pseudomonas sp. CFBP 13719]